MTSITAEDAFVRFRAALWDEVRLDVRSGGLDPDGPWTRRWYDLVYDVCFWCATQRTLDALRKTYAEALVVDDPRRDVYTDKAVLADIAERYAAQVEELRYLIQQFWFRMRMHGLSDGQIEGAFDVYHRDVLETPLPEEWNRS